MRGGAEFARAARRCGIGVAEWWRGGVWDSNAPRHGSSPRHSITLLCHHLANWSVVTAAFTLVLTGFSPEARAQANAPTDSLRALLLHRYSFNESSEDTCHDSVGDKDGKLMNGAYFDGAGQVVLSNRLETFFNPQYVALPPGLFTNCDALTFELWVTPRLADSVPLAGWARMWEFGNQNQREDGTTVGVGVYLFACVGNASLKPRSYMFIENGGDRRCISSQELLRGQKNHWVWTASTAQHSQRVYLNGVMTGTDDWFDYLSALAAQTTNNWLGRSQFFPDPALNGEIDEFRIYQGALTPLEVAAHYLNGADSYPGESTTVTALRLELTNALYAGQCAQAALYATVAGLTNPVNLSLSPGLPISFLSADPKVATVDAAGKVCGVSAGETEISAGYDGFRGRTTVRVAQHLSVAGVAPASAAYGTRTQSPGLTWLDLEGRCAGAGEFLPGEQLQDIMLPQPVVGRYFCLESLSAFDGLPYAGMAELNLLDNDGRPLSREGWTVCYADSEERNVAGGNGRKENVLDGNSDTDWCTQLFRASPNHPHRLVLDLGKPLRIAGFRYLPRSGFAGVQGRIKEYRVYAGDDLLRTNAQPRAFPARCYIFGYFEKEGAGGLHLAYSLNGYHWEILDSGHSFLSPTIGRQPLLRDPCLFRQTNGAFGLLWTIGVGWSGNAIGYATSTNLMDWSEQRALPLMAGAAPTFYCWAPEAFWDEPSQQYVVLWASDLREGPGPPVSGTGKSRIYAATTRDFNHFSPARMIYDSGSSADDPTVLRANGRYHLWFRLPNNHLRVVTADHPLGPFGNPRSPITQGNIEGPCLFPLKGRYALFAHGLGQNRYFAFASPDLERWDDHTSVTTLPPEAGQGSVLEISRETIQALVKAGRMDWGPIPGGGELGVGDWIWTTNVLDKQICRLWRDFTVPKAGVSHARLRITADDTYRAYLDGREVGHAADAKDLTDHDVTLLLSPGHHVLAVEAFNEVMGAGVLAGLHVTLKDGKSMDVFSDSSWRVADNHDAGWETAKKPSSVWINAEIVGYAGRDWWQYPRRIFDMPPLLPPAIHFWQQTWFVSVILGLLVVGLAFTFKQRLQLAIQNRSNRLLEDLVQQRTSELRCAHDHLEEQVIQRTAELKLTNDLLEQDIAKREQAEAALLQARAELEKASRATTVGELAASIAHEVNQPLAGVVTSANAGLNWMATTPPNLDKAREALARIVRDGTRAGQVLDRIRSLFRRSAPTSSPVNLNQAVRDVVALAQRELRQNQVELFLKLTEPLPAIMGDSIQLQQVLANLIRNAVEAMADTGDRRKTVRITSSVGDLGGKPAVALTVTDTGVGFSATDQKRLFEAFHTTKPQGMGMGLWISRSIVEAHGGQLTAHTNEGPGATFQILIPVLADGQL